MFNYCDALIKIAKELTEVEKKRRSRKVDALRNIASQIIKLRRRITKDLESENEKEQLTALVVSIMDKTAERVGNEDSAENDHVGVTGFKKKNVMIEKNTIHFNYVGKSGVEHEKKLTDEKIAEKLKVLLNRANSEEDFIFTTEDGFKIKADRINRFLDEFGVTAKDIRGYAANRLTIEALNNAKPLNDESERVKKFRDIVKMIAEKVGHGANTLRIHYLLPNLEREYVKNNKIINIREA